LKGKSGTNKDGWSAIKFYTWDFVWQPKN